MTRKRKTHSDKQQIVVVDEIIKTCPHCGRRQPWTTATSKHKAHRCTGCGTWWAIR